MSNNEPKHLHFKRWSKKFGYGVPRIINQYRWYRSVPIYDFLLYVITDVIISLKRKKTKKRKSNKHWNRSIWPTIRKYRQHLDGYKCVRCGSRKNLQCHHLHYDYIDDEREILSVRTLCHDCHRKVHGK